jgi:hypothetical protein
MVSSVNNSALVNSLNSSYQRLQQAQSRVEETRREVDQNRAALENSNDRLEKDKSNYASEMSRTKTLEKGDLKYAIQSSTGTQQIQSAKSATSATGTSNIYAQTPTVNTSGQTVGTTINTTA